jgi:phosphatidylcholine synthase
MASGQIGASRLDCGAPDGVLCSCLVTQIVWRKSMHGAAMKHVPKQPSIRARRAFGLSVHILTASGAAAAVLALKAAVEGDFTMTFAWLGAALFIDGIDGTLARAAKVTETAAYIDGIILDLVVDFLTYVIVPVVALWRSDLIPAPLSFWIGLVVTVASALYFADMRMKTKDLWFRGFPAIFNVLALYLFVFKMPGFVNAAALLLATLLMFAPIVFVHPLRVEKLRHLTVAVTAAWLIFAGIAVADHLSTSLVVKLGLIATGLYFLALPLLRHSPWAEDPADEDLE